MIPRTLEPLVRAQARRYPVVVVTGPRQSGKTTLCRAAFGDRPYVSLEAPDEREFALGDPRGFLARYGGGAVIDEMQHAPELLSYLQGIVDEAPRRKGRFVLTGSQNLALHHGVSQSLAGRAAMLTLLPLSLEELRGAGLADRSLFETLFAGGYPRIHADRLPPSDWLGNYVATYVERDVRSLLAVGDLATFQTFVRLCAGRSAQLVNLSALGADAGVSHNTARSWLSVLEAGYLVQRLAPWHGSPTSRLVKTPKLHFLDSGLLCWLLGIRQADQIEAHPLRGAIFESFVVSEVLKARVHRGEPAELWFLRDRRGREIDLVLADAGGACALEMKSGQTAPSGAFADLAAADELLPGARRRPPRRMVVFGGETSQRRSEGDLVSWRDLADPLRVIAPRAAGGRKAAASRARSGSSTPSRARGSGRK